MIPRARVFLAFAVAVVGCGRVERAGAPRLAVGAPAPAPLAAHAGEEAVVGWVVRPEQLVTCETAALQLRRVHRRFGARLGITVVTPRSDSGFVRRFLRRERPAGVEVVGLADAEFSARFGAAVPPALWLSARGRIAGRFPADRATLLDGDGSMQMERAVAALLDRDAVPETLPSSAHDRRGSP
jgi:hypothetical protein